MDIRVEGVSKSFGDNTVINNFNVVFCSNRFTCIMGPSGCGKTTLLYMLMGFIKPDNGIIHGVPEKKSAVFQEDRLCMSFSAVSNVRFVCQKRITTQIIEQHLTEIGLKDSIYMPVNELSGGMKRRVAIVRSVLAESDVVFLDEPFKGLDADTKMFVMRYVKNNMKNKTVIMVTHSEDEAAEMGGELVRMKMEGKYGNNSK